MHKLEELCEINIGKTPSRSNPAFWNGSYPWLSIADMNQGRILFETKEKITAEGIGLSGIKKVSKGTLVLSYKLSIGKVGVCGKDLYTNEAIAALPIIDTSILNIEYLYWALKTIDLLETSDKAAMGKTLNKAKLKELKIPLPPLAEQKRIAGILDAADKLRAKRRESIAQLDTLLQSTFLDMFGDPVTNPMGWDVERLGQCVPNINVGHVGPTSHGYVETGKGVQFLRTQNVRRNALDLTDVRYISDEFDVKLSKSKIYVGDVLVSRVGVNRGMAATVTEEVDGSNCANVVIIRASDQINPAFLSELINGRHGEKTLMSGSVGAAQGVINVGTLDRWNVLVPPLNLQQEFSDAVESIEKQSGLLSAHLTEMDNLFASLQQRAFNGTL